MKIQEFTGIRDWKLRDILEGDIVVTQQGTKFVVEWSEEHNMGCLIQSNEGKLPDLQGDWFELAKYMQPNLEVIGTIYDTPELMSDGNDKINGEIKDRLFPENFTQQEGNIGTLGG